MTSTKQPNNKLKTYSQKDKNISDLVNKEDKSVKKITNLQVNNLNLNTNDLKNEVTNKQPQGKPINANANVNVNDVKKRSHSQLNSRLTTLLNSNKDEDTLLVNNENSKLIDNYFNKIGVVDKVDYNYNLNKLKLYKKILDDTNKYINTNGIHSFNNSDLTSSTSSLTGVNFNVKLIDISNKLLQSHQENNKLVIRVKELEEKQSLFDEQINELKLENYKLLNRINQLSLSNKEVENLMHSNNNNNISINFTLNNLNGEANKGPVYKTGMNVQDLNNSIALLTEENNNLKNFRNQVFDISKSIDEINNSIINSMKVVNLVIEQFNLSGNNDPSLKRLIEIYFRKLFFKI